MVIDLEDYMNKGLRYPDFGFDTVQINPIKSEETPI